MLLASYTLWLREIVRFYRDRTRVVGEHTERRRLDGNRLATERPAGTRG